MLTAGGIFGSIPESERKQRYGDWLSEMLYPRDYDETSRFFAVRHPIVLFDVAVFGSSQDATGESNDR